MSQSKQALLVLEDGTAYRGSHVGHEGTTGGEICFNTGMTGYQEIYTDPSYFGQIIVNTTSHIGNYGVRLLDEEESASIKISGLVCNSFSQGTPGSRQILPCRLISKVQILSGSAISIRAIW